MQTENEKLEAETELPVSQEGNPYIIPSHFQLFLLMSHDISVWYFPYHEYILKLNDS